MPRRSKGARPRGAALVGQKVRVWWGGEGTWYSGAVVRYSTRRRLHLVHYDDDDQREHELDGPLEEWELLPSKSASAAVGEAVRPPMKPPATPAAPPCAPQRENGKPRLERGTPEVDELLAGGKRMVGYRVRVYWGGNSEWYSGQVVQYEPHFFSWKINYDDGEVKWHELLDSDELWEFDEVETDPQASAAARQEQSNAQQKQMAKVATQEKAAQKAALKATMARKQTFTTVELSQRQSNLHHPKQPPCEQRKPQLRRVAPESSSSSECEATEKAEALDALVAKSQSISQPPRAKPKDKKVLLRKASAHSESSTAKQSRKRAAQLPLGASTQTNLGDYHRPAHVGSKRKESSSDDILASAKRSTASGVSRKLS
ncbi:MAG: hypothetical protein SGPRY_004313 [Prymnesium sp.]